MKPCARASLANAKHRKHCNRKRQKPKDYESHQDWSQQVPGNHPVHFGTAKLTDYATYREWSLLKVCRQKGTNQVGGGDELLLRAIACPLEGFDAIGFAAGRVEDFAVAYALESGAYQADSQHVAGRI